MAKFSTQALLLKKTPYSETSLILKLLTEDKGIQSYIFQGAKRKGKKGNILQSLSWIELSGYYRSDSSMGKISEVNFVQQWERIPTDIYRSTILMFMTEVLNKVITESTDEKEIYDFLVRFLKRLDDSYFPKESHLFFLVQIINYLGVQPQNTEIKNPKYFDFLEGEFLLNEPPHHVFEKGVNVTKLHQAFQFENPDQSYFSNGSERMLVVTLLLKYLSVHFDELDDLKSLDVIETILK